MLRDTISHEIHLDQEREVETKRGIYCDVGDP